eukprot:TRINITY_DN3627_c0_g1_i71.p1 TRINITY_DN3627_c0_g1~~TRINITY_DN3627_c0_g1_i71.p1  ORF type:complete len:151 (-),score=18.02 TRINITY_DN3627_c0_g1_i71:1770-2222(-)
MEDIPSHRVHSNVDPCIFSQLKPRQVWVPPESVTSCMVCKEEFSFLLWKHHCRRCGVCACDNCCSFMPPPISVRVCVPCAKDHTQKVREKNRFEMAQKMLKKDVTAKEMAYQVQWYKSQEDIPIQKEIIKRRVLQGDVDGVIKELLEKSF